MSAVDGPTLFGEVVAALEPTVHSVAPFILTRLLLRARIFDRAGMGVEDLQRALPVLEAGLAESLTPAETASCVRRVKEVVLRHQR